MVSAFGSLWVPTCGDGALQRIDPKTFKVTATVPSGAADIRGSIAASTDSIWLLTDNRETLSRIDPDQNAVVGEIRLPVGCNSMIFAETAIWLACPEQNRILKINPATNVVDKRIEVAGRPLSITSGEGSIWVLCGKDGKVDRIDPKTDKVTKSIELLVPNAEGAIAYGMGFVWVTMNGFPVTRIDATAETVAQQFWGEGGGGLTTGGGAIWLSNLSAGTVARVDPKLLLATLAE
jgi:streptogramin lyase